MLDRQRQRQRKVRLRDRLTWSTAVIIILGAVVGLSVLAFLMNVLVMPVIVRSGQRVEVPNVVGLSRAATGQVLGRVGLRLGRVDLMVSADIQPDAVISQFPPAGSQVKAGREIMVVISQGPLRIEVPELRGISLRNARLLLNEVDLVVGLLSQAHHPDYEFGTVISQYPLSGVRVAPRTEVFFLTSIGKREEGYVMGDLVGSRLAQIGPLIRDSRPVRYDVRYLIDPSRPAETVVEQVPTPGYYVGPDSTVSLVVTVER